MVSEDSMRELQALCPEAKQATEAGIDYVLLPACQMPDECDPTAVDCLLCLGPRDGYENRLYFSQAIKSRAERNWNGQNVRILERNWFAYSWKVPGGLRPIEILIGHVQALR